MIVGLYLIVPLLRPIAQNETLAALFSAAWRLFSTFCCRSSAHCLCSVCPGSSTAATSRCRECYTTTSRSALPPILCWAAISAARSFRPKRPVGAMRSAWPVFIVTVVMTSYASRRLGTATVLFYNYNSVGVLLMCLAVFVFARRHLNFPSLGEKGHARIRAALPLELRRLPRASAVHRDVRSISRRQHALLQRLFLRAASDAAHRHAVLFAISALLSRVPIVNKYFV